MVWTWKKALLWAAIAIVCACGWAILAVSRGERISAIWFLVVALSSYAIAYRFYAYYIQIQDHAHRRRERHPGRARA